MCHLCYTKVTRHTLKFHLRDVHGIQPLTCESCSKPFLNQKVLDGHKSICTGPVGEKTFECEICHLKLTRGSSLKYHQRRIHGLHLLTCKSCSKEFQTVRSLKDHKLVCTGSTDEGLPTVVEFDTEDSESYDEEE